MPASLFFPFSTREEDDVFRLRLSVGDVVEVDFTFDRKERDVASGDLGVL